MSLLILLRVFYLVVCGVVLVALLAIACSMTACATPPCPSTVAIAGDTRGTGTLSLEFELGVRHRDCASLNGGERQEEDGEVWWEEPAGE